MASPRRAPPELMEELIEEVLLRFPPTDPAGLFRAALVCKRWARLISSPRFRRRYSEAHRGAAMLGLLCNLKDVNGEYVARYISFSGYVPASSPTSTPSTPRRTDVRGWRALDARHGRVLLRSLVWAPYLDVWDPVTGERRETTATPPLEYRWNAAVLCARHGTCDHLDCRGGPFLVFVLGANDPDNMLLCVYSSETARWSMPWRVALFPDHGVDVVPPALVGNALYFGVDMSRSILKYDLDTRKASVIRQPRGSFGHFTVLMGMDDRGLGIARLVGSRLTLWSMSPGPDGGAKWAKIRTIELHKRLPVHSLPMSSDFVGYAQDFGIFFVGTEDGLYSFDHKSGVVRKVCDDKGIHHVVPYIALYTPTLQVALTGEGSAGASSA